MNKDLEQTELNDDAISRQAVLDLIADYDLSMGQVVRGIHTLPSVSVAEKTGHWIDDTDGHGTSCSKCGKWYPHSYLTKQDVIYCCRCGTKMVEPQESDGKE